MLNNLDSIRYIIPEIILLCALFLTTGLGAFRATRKKIYITVVSCLGFGAGLIVTMLGVSWPISSEFTFEGMFVADGMTSVFREIFMLTGLFTIMFAYASNEIDERDIADTSILVNASVIGMDLMAGAADLLMLYLSMEFVSLLSYVLSGLKREDQRSSEAALKYAIYGGAASGVMLFGISFLYGITGDTAISEIRGVLLKGDGFANLTSMALIMVISGMAYKIAAVPFHMWCPDVYQGAPTPITAFLSVGPKAAGFALLMRFLAYLVGGVSSETLMSGLTLLTAVISVATMTLGNLSALQQSSIKRMLAYSSIAHAGYMLLGIATLPIVMKEGNYTGFQAVFLYLVVYLFMNLGAFFVVTYVVNEVGNDEIYAFRALGQRSPFIAVMMVIFLLSLTGIPPTAGYIGKFYIFYALIKTGGWLSYVLALIGVLNSFVSLFYYARIMKAMYLEPSEDLRKLPKYITFGVILGLLAIPTIFFGIYFTPILEASSWVMR